LNFAFLFTVNFLYTLMSSLKKSIFFEVNLMKEKSNFIILMRGRVKRSRTKSFLKRGQFKNCKIIKTNAKYHSFRENLPIQKVFSLEMNISIYALNSLKTKQSITNLTASSFSRLFFISFSSIQNKSSFISCILIIQGI